MKYARMTLVLMFIAIVSSIPSLAQQREIKVEATKLSENLYMLADGAGGNMALALSDEGALLIDTTYAHKQLLGKLDEAIKKITDKPAVMAFNTHWHFDHVGGNEFFHDKGAAIAAHENVRNRMSKDQVIDHIDARPPASPDAALPTITYKGEMTLYWGAEEVHIFHVPNAHTDGDSFVHFRKANVLHVADTCFAGMYPFIDVNAGGTIDGMINAAETALKIADEETKIIPGHGPMTSASELREYRGMLAATRDAVGELIEAGKTRAETVAAKPTKDLDEKWGGGGFPPDKWVAIAYDSMKRKTATSKQP